MLSKYVINASVVSDDGRVTMFLGTIDGFDPLFLYRVPHGVLVRRDGSDISSEEIMAIVKFERAVQIKNAKFTINPINYTA